MDAPAPRVAIRCDATQAIGLGHLLRCLALAEALQESGLRPVVLGDVTSVPFAADQLAALGLDRHPCPDDTGRLLALLEEIDAPVLVIDSYDVSPDTHESVQASGRAVIAVVDAPAPSLAADLLVNQNIGAATAMRERHRGRVLAGPEFALLRGAITRQRSPTPPVSGPARRVLVLAGGTDVRGAAPLLAELLLRTGLPLTLDVVCANDLLRAQVEALPVKGGQQVVAHAPLNDLAGLAVCADLVVTAAGTSVLELACLGRAMALVTVADNQLAGASAVAAAGAALNLGDVDAACLDADATTALLAELLTDQARRQELSSRAYALVDGEGRHRVAEEIRAIPRG